ncbi:MAG: hypothetical protein ACXVI6_04770 [Candidatus Aminicenantales bacterium]
MKKGILALLVLAFMFAVVAPAFAEEAAQEAKPAANPPLKTELIRLKYFNVQSMFGLVKIYQSRDGRISQGPDAKILVVSDYPENIDKILQAIRQIDVKPADLQFTVQLVLGTAGETDQGTKPMPANDPIIKELSSLLKYSAYSLLDTSVMRAMDNSDTEVRMGERAEFEFSIRPKVVKDEKGSLIQMEVRLRQIRIAGTPPNATSSGRVHHDRPHRDDSQHQAG